MSGNEKNKQRLLELRKKLQNTERLLENLNQITDSRETDSISVSSLGSFGRKKNKRTSPVKKKVIDVETLSNLSKENLTTSVKREVNSPQIETASLERERREQLEIIERERREHFEKIEREYRDKIEKEIRERIEREHREQLTNETNNHLSHQKLEQPISILDVTKQEEGSSIPPVNVSQFSVQSLDSPFRLDASMANTSSQSSFGRAKKPREPLYLSDVSLPPDWLRKRRDMDETRHTTLPRTTARPTETAGYPSPALSPELGPASMSLLHTGRDTEGRPRSVSPSAFLASPERGERVVEEKGKREAEERREEKKFDVSSPGGKGDMVVVQKNVLLRSVGEEKEKTGAIDRMDLDSVKFEYLMKNFLKRNSLPLVMPSPKKDVASPSKGKEASVSPEALLSPPVSVRSVSRSASVSPANKHIISPVSFPSGDITNTPLVSLRTLSSPKPRQQTVEAARVAVSASGSTSRQIFAANVAVGTHPVPAGEVSKIANVRSIVNPIASTTLVAFANTASKTVLKKAPSPSISRGEMVRGVEKGANVGNQVLVKSTAENAEESSESFTGIIKKFLRQNITGQETANNKEGEKSPITTFFDEVMKDWFSLETANSANDANNLSWETDNHNRTSARILDAESGGEGLSTFARWFSGEEGEKLVNRVLDENVVSPPPSLPASLPVSPSPPRPVSIFNKQRHGDASAVSLQKDIFDVSHPLLSSSPTVSPRTVIACPSDAASHAPFVDATTMETQGRVTGEKRESEEERKGEERRGEERREKGRELEKFSEMPLPVEEWFNGRSQLARVDLSNLQQRFAETVLRTSCDKFAFYTATLVSDAKQDAFEKLMLNTEQRRITANKMREIAQVDFLMQTCREESRNFSTTSLFPSANESHQVKPGKLTSLRKLVSSHANTRYSSNLFAAETETGEDIGRVLSDVSLFSDPRVSEKMMSLTDEKKQLWRELKQQLATVRLFYVLRRMHQKSQRLNLMVAHESLRQRTVAQQIFEDASRNHTAAGERLVPSLQHLSSQRLHLSSLCALSLSRLRDFSSAVNLLANRYATVRARTISRKQAKDDAARILCLSLKKVVMKNSYFAFWRLFHVSRQSQFSLSSLPYPLASTSPLPLSSLSPLPLSSLSPLQFASTTPLPLGSSLPHRGAYPLPLPHQSSATNTLLSPSLSRNVHATHTLLLHSTVSNEQSNSSTVPDHSEPSASGREKQGRVLDRKEEGRGEEKRGKERRDRRGEVYIGASKFTSEARKDSPPKFISLPQRHFSQRPSSVGRILKATQTDVVEQEPATGALESPGDTLPLGSKTATPMVSAASRAPSPTASPSPSPSVPPLSLSPSLPPSPERIVAPASPETVSRRSRFEDQELDNLYEKLITKHSRELETISPSRTSLRTVVENETSLPIQRQILIQRETGMSFGDLGLNQAFEERDITLLSPITSPREPQHRESLMSHGDTSSLSRNASSPLFGRGQDSSSPRRTGMARDYDGSGDSRPTLDRPSSPSFKESLNLVLAEQGRVTSPRGVYREGSQTVRRNSVLSADGTVSIASPRGSGAKPGDSKGLDGKGKNGMDDTIEMGEDLLVEVWGLEKGASRDVSLEENLKNGRCVFLGESYLQKFLRRMPFKVGVSVNAKLPLTAWRTTTIVTNRSDNHYLCKGETDLSLLSQMDKNVKPTLEVRGLWSSIGSGQSFNANITVTLSRLLNLENGAHGDEFGSKYEPYVLIWMYNKNEKIMRPIMSSSLNFEALSKFPLQFQTTLTCNKK